VVYGAYTHNQLARLKLVGNAEGFGAGGAAGGFLPMDPWERYDYLTRQGKLVTPPATPRPSGRRSRTRPGFTAPGPYFPRVFGRPPGF
ncbi:MAG: hypothetical protein ACRDHG_13635, partial [Anaerolineales bacterium]